MVDHGLLPARSINLDVLVRLARRTVASPWLAILMLITSWLREINKATSVVNKAYGRRFRLYFGLCWTLWLLTWSSRVWRCRSWQHGFAGLAGVNRINWQRQIAVVTGGRGGLGQAVIAALERKGVQIAVLDRKSSNSEERSEGLVHYYTCDVSDFDQVQAVGKKIAVKLGHPTIVVNCAGTVCGKSLLEISPEEVTRTMRVNVFGPFWTMKAFLPGMIDQSAGHIVNVSSIFGTLAVPYMSDYCASKYALIGMHESMEAELRKTNLNNPVRLTLVLPSHIRTSLFARIKPFSAGMQFFLPMLEPADVAAKIVRRIETDQQGELSMPMLVNITWLYRALPSYVQGFLRWITDVDDLTAYFQRDPSEACAQQSLESPMT